MKKCLFITGMLFCFLGNALGQSAGDIAFIGFNADSLKDLQIVVLSDLPSTTIYFTDNEWDSTTFTSGEGALTWVTGGAISAGTVVSFNEVNSAGNTNFGASMGSLTRSGSFNPGGSNEAIYAFLGTDSSTPTTFLASISNEVYDTGAPVGTLFGTGLTESTTAVNIDGDEDVAVYTGLRQALDKTAYLALIGNTANWTTADGSGNQSGSFLPFSTTLFEFTNTVSISGDAGWRMLSLPVTGADVEDISDDTAIQGITGGSNASDAANFFINTASDGTGTSGWSEPTNTTTAWGDGLGFITFFYDNTTAGSSELPVTLDASGTEPGSDVAVTLSDTYTLVGNPFGSNIELDDLTGNDAGMGVNDGLVSPVSVWNDGIGTDGSGSWDTFNFGEGNEISTWQGFFVQRNSGSTTSLTIPVSAKTDSAADASVFSKVQIAKWRRINFELKTEGFQDISNKLYFSEVSSSNKDGFDGAKLRPFNNAPYISFVQDFGEGSEYLVQDARAFNPDGIQEYVLDFNDMGVSGSFTLSWPEWKNIPSDWSLKLVDRVDNNEIDMRVEKVYSFNIQSNKKRPSSTVLVLPALKAKSSDNQPRFNIILVPGISVSNEPEEKPEAFALHQNYPNPFNPETTIQYSVGQTGPVTITIYNVMGQKVAELVNTTKTAGTYQVSWNATGQASGIYYYRLTAPEQSFTRQMTLIK